MQACIQDDMCACVFDCVSSCKWKLDRDMEESNTVIQCMFIKSRCNEMCFCVFIWLWNMFFTSQRCSRHTLMLTLASAGSIGTCFQLEEVPGKDLSVYSGTDSYIYSMLLSGLSKSTNASCASFCWKTSGLDHSMKTCLTMFLQQNIYIYQYKSRLLSIKIL